MRTLDLKFTYMEAAGCWTTPTTTTPNVAEQQRQRDRARDEWEKDMRTMCRLLRDLEVRVIKKHDKKGRFGTVTREAKTVASGRRMLDGHQAGIRRPPGKSKLGVCWVCAGCPGMRKPHGSGMFPSW